MNQFIDETQLSIPTTNASAILSLNLAISRRSLPTIKCILRVLDVSVRLNNNGQSVMHVAASLPGDDTELVSYLLSKGASITEKDVRGNTALRLAARYGNQEIFQYLANKHAVVDQDTLLLVHEQRYFDNLWEISQQWQDTMTAIIIMTAPVTLRGAMNKTPFRIAVDLLEFEDVKNLITKGADVNVEDSDRSRPLHMAARRGRADFVELLLANNAELNAKNRFKQTALHAAVNAGMCFSGPSNNTSYSANEDVIQLLVGRGIQLRATCSYRGWTALDYAASNSNMHKRVAELLLNEYLKDGGITNSARSKALKIAVEAKNHSVVSLLGGVMPHSVEETIGDVQDNEHSDSYYTHNLYMD